MQHLDPARRVEMAERHPETDLSALGTPWVNGVSLPVGQIRIMSGQAPELSEGSADADGESIETSSEQPTKAASSLNDGHSAVSQISIAPTEPPELSEESADADDESIETSSEARAELNNLVTGPSHRPGGSSESLSETDWETTRYLAAATQLNLRYARFVVGQILREPF